MYTLGVRGYVPQNVYSVSTRVRTRVLYTLGVRGYVPEYVYSGNTRVGVYPSIVYSGSNPGTYPSMAKTDMFATWLPPDIP